MKPIFTCLLALVLLIISAYLSVTLPISEKGIPFTAQSLVVFILAGLLKPREFLLVVIAYLLLGVLGAPVFAEGSFGWSKIVGSSGGFLYGFLGSGLLISFMINRTGSRSFSYLLFAMFLGTLVLFFFGIGHLAMKFGFSKALEYGFYPFWKMALVKAFLAGMVVFVAKRYISLKIKA